VTTSSETARRYTADAAFGARQISFMVAAKCRFPSKYNMDSEIKWRKERTTLVN